MRRLIVLLLGTGLFAGGAVFAEINLFGVLETQQDVYVDTVTVDDEVTFETRDFGGREVVDTFDFGVLATFPYAAIISFTVEGERMPALRLDPLEPDNWYPLEGFDQPAQIMFYETTVGLEEGGRSPVPVLISALPNPFATATRLRCELASTAMVTADVFDRSGCLVRRLAARQLEPGAHVFDWNGDDGAGARLSSGVYLLRFRAGADEQLLKLLLTD